MSNLLQFALVEEVRLRSMMHGVTKIIMHGVEHYLLDAASATFRVSPMFAIRDPPSSAREEDEFRRLCRFRKLGRRPWFRAAREEVAALVSPRNWLGVARMRRISLDPVWKGVLGIILPIVLYKVTFFSLSSRAGVPRNQLPPPRAMLLLYLLSPWALYVGFLASHPIFQTACTVLAFRMIFRSTTLDEATVALGQRVATGRAVRCRRYDLYLPPPNSHEAPAANSGATAKLKDSADDDDATATSAPAIVLMLTGAGVSPTSYAPVAALLSDAGMHVAVLNSEPNLRLPSHHLGYDTVHCLSIQREVLEQLRYPSRIIQWFGLGHSMGCFSLSHLDHEALRMRRIVFWGASPLFVQDLADLSEAGGRLSLLVVQGGDDKLIEMARTSSAQPQQPDLIAQFESKLPRDPGATTTRVLPGGTHRGFGSYESRQLTEPQSLESRTWQQHEAVRLTVQFLLGDSSRQDSRTAAAGGS
jgi:hypothetical protein